MKINNYTEWILENLGNGIETFESELKCYRDDRNLSVTLPVGIGDLDDASGKIIYQLEIDANSAGIKNFNFTILSIELEIEYYENGDEEDKKILNVSLSKDILTEIEIEIEIYKLPFYVSSLDIDLQNIENSDGELDYKETKITLEIGYND